MEEVKSSFSRKELKNFLKELARQVESGKVAIEIPGYSKGKAKIKPEQPIDVVFTREKEERRMTIEIELNDHREL
ncbi:MAG: amphi-Trp domain-containing protein [Candidatus Aenigmatarchaeota archaeon]